jgi:hypothetical protein
MPADTISAAELAAALEVAPDELLHAAWRLRLPFVSCAGEFRIKRKDMPRWREAVRCSPE